MYNDFGQLVRENQQHGAAVDTATSLFVEYGYADGSSNTIRPTFIKYPNGRQVDHDYGVASSQTDRLSRIASLEDGGGIPGSQSTTYGYTGNGQIINTRYVEPDLSYSIPGGVSGGYTGLDRFGRVTQLRWNDGTDDVVGFDYGYDRRSNRLFERNTFSGPVGTNPVSVDALLQYDGLDRLVDFGRGKLNVTNDAIITANLTQDWTLDQTGNWNAFNQGVDTPLNQTRTHNTVNEITDIAKTTGADWADPTHDSNGNMTSIPKPSDLTTAYDAKWDAWNRLVELSDGGEIVSSYQYDGTNRRIVVAENATVGGIDAGFLESDIVFIPEQWDGAPNAGEFDVTGTYFKTGPDAAETINIGNVNRGIGVDDNATGAGYMMYSVESVHTRFTVNQYNADHIVAVRLNGTQWQYNSNAIWINFTPVASDRLLASVDFTADTAINLGWTRVYYSQSAQAVEERHGTQLHQQYVWGLRFIDDLILSDRDTTDNGTLDQRLYALHDLRFSIVAIVNPSGTIVERFTYDAYGRRTVLDGGFEVKTSSTYNQEFAYTGRRLDNATGLYFFRARYYSAELGRFIGRDPLEFVDGMSLYQAYFVPGGVDPSGRVHCEIKSPAKYNVSGQIPGRMVGDRREYPFQFTAEFIHDPCRGALCECCEVRQEIMWDLVYFDFMVTGGFSFGGPHHLSADHTKAFAVQKTCLTGGLTIAMFEENDMGIAVVICHSVEKTLVLGSTTITLTVEIHR